MRTSTEVERIDPAARIVCSLPRLGGSARACYAWPIVRDEPIDAASTGGHAEDLRQASREVDMTLIRWFESLSPRQRLREATRMSRMLGRFSRVTPSEAG